MAEHMFDRAEEFPYPSETSRLGKYRNNALLLESNHFEAFAIQGEKQFTRQYRRLRYVVANFMSLVAKVSADTLFGEEIDIQANDNQQWLESFYFHNNLKTQLFESAISNSALGDAVFKIRVEDGEVIAEDINPATYFPHLNSMNARQEPEVEEIAFKHSVGENKYLVREIHRPGSVETRVFRLEEGKIGAEVNIDTFNEIAGTQFDDFVETGIERNLIIHIPNYRTRGNVQYFGISDFNDLETLQFELNNRLTKVGNILDKHSDPILAVPEGVLDEDGNVRREAFHMIEVGEDGNAPEYIVWNANLDAAFQQIDKLVEFLFMTSEVSPDVLGMGEGGQAESGRALKMRLIRTLAKRNRKRLYYDQGIKEVLTVAQQLASANGFTVDGETLPAEPEMPEVVWSDGVVDDELEETQLNVAQVEAGLKSKKTTIMQLFGYGEEQAEEELERINEEGADFTSITDTTVV